MRTSRTDGTTTYKYVYNGGSLVQMTVGSNTLYFTSDTVTFNGVIYYYVKNLQGDVTAIVDGSGAAVATYVYDAWGNLISDEPAENTIGHLNPIRYRGYVYDPESGFYYLQSRYYDPELGRFLNADAFASTGQGLLGNNMFAYCNNNSVNVYDPSGTIPFYDDPLQQAIEEVCKWYRETDENEKDGSGEYTLSATIKRMVNSFVQNFEFSCGIGMGFELEAEVAEVIGLGAGMHGDLIHFRYEDGAWSYGQEISGGVAISAFFHHLGYVESVYNKYFIEGPLEVSSGFYGDETLTLFSTSLYAGIGGHIRIGFDVVGFWEQSKQILDGGE